VNDIRQAWNAEMSRLKRKPVEGIVVWIFLIAYAAIPLGAVFSR